MRLTSPTFENQQEIPERFTCEGKNVSPPLSFGDVPEDAAALVLILDDPDAPSGTFTHWIVYDIPPLRSQLPEGFSPGVDASEGIREGRNSAGNVRYDGPCPPSMGGKHHYHFRLYAVDTELGLPSGANRDQVFDLIHDHILDETELVGVFERSPNL
ncbi:MAG: YbhB/YbcL family Raf kinase inhibitor-like protein [Anaerolineae bacterium]